MVQGGVVEHFPNICVTETALLSLSMARIVVSVAPVIHGGDQVRVGQSGSATPVTFPIPLKASVTVKKAQPWGCASCEIS